MSMIVLQDIQSKMKRLVHRVHTVKLMLYEYRLLLKSCINMCVCDGTESLSTVLEADTH